MNIRTTIRALSLLACFCFSLAAKAQQTKISGTIKNEKGEPVEAASVQVTGNNTGSLSDKNGSFTLTASPNDSLRITYIGYDTLTVSASQYLNIVLHPA